MDNIYTCENCGKKFNISNGILAEIVDNKIVMNNCSPFTKITELCDKCVEELGIKRH